MSFIDQKPQVATARHCQAPWGGVKNGQRFKCYLCGYKFKVGDVWRWIYAGGAGLINFITCEKCDGPDVLERWVAMNREYKELRKKFWALEKY